MLVQCGCGAKYRYDERKFRGAQQKRLDCPKCGQVIVVNNPELFSTKMHNEVLDASLTRLKKPTFILSVLRGMTGGMVIPLDRPRFTIGRLGADIEIDDPEASRVHAELRIQDNNVILHDLNSSNGTFVNGKRITEIVLQDDTEFRIGQTRFELHKVLLTFD